MSNGQMALIDDEHYVEVLNAGPWHKHSRGYVHRTIKVNGKKTSQYLHKFIGELVGLSGELDHKNLDKLDCQADNLRQVSRQQNMRNLPRYRSNTSGAKGVSWRSDLQKYRVRITTDFGRLDLGYFTTLEEAAEAYRIASGKYHGVYGRSE